MSYFDFFIKKNVMAKLHECFYMCKLCFQMLAVENKKNEVHGLSDAPHCGLFTPTS